MVVETAGTTPDPQLVRKLRHDIRGCMHGLCLCMAALETPMTRDDSAEFLQDIMTATERMEALMAKWAEIYPDEFEN